MVHPDIHQAFQQLVTSLTSLYEEREARSIARIVFEDALSISHFDRTDLLTSGQLKSLDDINKRLLTHEPVQYVLGQTDFYGLPIKVDRRVLIPRQETEELVHWIIACIRKASNIKRYRLLDIGTGSGCIPIILKNKLPDLQIYAVDFDEDILSLAKENARINATAIDFLVLDILDNSEWGKLPAFDLIVSNPPYIPIKQHYLMPDQVLRFEPREALFVPDTDPLLFYRKITGFAKEKLHQGGWIFFEVNEFLADEVILLMSNEGFEECCLQKDMSGKPRMARARWKINA